MIDIPTLGGPMRNTLAQGQTIAKRCCFLRDSVAVFETAYRGTIDNAHDIKFPLIVKTLEDGSIGIDAAAVGTRPVKELMARRLYTAEFDSPALIEEYIDGTRDPTRNPRSYEKPMHFAVELTPFRSFAAC